jgi:hypothetical protein
MKEAELCEVNKVDPVLNYHTINIYGGEVE